MLPPEALGPRFMPPPPEAILPRVTPTPRITPIPRVGPMPEMPIPRLAPIPETVPRVGPTPPGPGPTPIPEPFPYTGPLPTPAPTPQPSPGPQVKPTPEETEEEEKKKRKGCGTKTLPNTVVTYTPGPLGQGMRVKASPLTRCPPAEGPGTLPAEWIYKPQFECLAKNGQGDFWVRMHLLHGKTSSAKIRNLHGPGDKMKNLVIGDKWVNQQMNRDVESKVIPRVYDQDAVLWYETKVDDYIKDNEYFVRKFTVTWGRYDTETGTELKPPLDEWVYAASKWPPSCPPSLQPSAPAVVPPGTPSTPSAPPAPPGTMKAFDSTFEVCRALETRVFDCPKGGITVRLDGSWFRPPDQPQIGCIPYSYKVTLVSKGMFLEDDVSTASVPVGGQSVSWSPLKPGKYKLRIEGVSPCCIKGTIGVDTFDAPMPMPIDPNQMA
jgi:hypothetical protein